MNNNDSPKPSDTTNQKADNKWTGRLIEISLLVVLFIGLSSWLSRHLLDDGSRIPELTLPALQPSPTATNRSLQWPAETDKTLIYFFAPWCSICRVSMPGLNLLPNNNLRIIAIAQDWQSREEVEKFISEVGYHGEVLLGNEQTRDYFRIKGYPSYYVLDRKGEVIHQDQGLSTPPGLWLRTQL